MVKEVVNDVVKGVVMEAVQKGMEQFMKVAREIKELYKRRLCNRAFFGELG